MDQALALAQAQGQQQQQGQYLVILLPAASNPQFQVVFAGTCHNVSRTTD
jgi:hypothetical protein